MATGDETILQQIEKQVAKLVDVRDIHELKPSESVYRELALIKVRTNSVSDRQYIMSNADIFRAKIVDVSPESLMVEITGDQSKIDAFLNLLSDYQILELARTGIAGLCRGTEGVVWL